MFRIGHAWDVHKLVPGRDLYLGGLKVSGYKVGLLGHSDADVVLHVVAESLLGSLALGDLGTFFPDNDELYKGIDSKIIVKECYKKVLSKGYNLSNLDLTIYAEDIKINKIRNDMIKSISALLGVSEDQVSVKATTYEKMGFIGEGKAVSAECVCLVEKARNSKVLL